MHLHELIPKEYCVRQRAYWHVHPHAYLGRAPLWVPAQTGQTRCRGASLSHQARFQEGEVTHPNKCRAGANQKGRGADISETCFALSGRVAFGLGMLTHPMTRVYRRGARDPTMHRFIPMQHRLHPRAYWHIASIRILHPAQRAAPEFVPTPRAAPEFIPARRAAQFTPRSASGCRIWTPLGERLPDLTLLGERLILDRNERFDNFATSSRTVRFHHFGPK